MTDEITTLNERMKEIAEQWAQWRESGIDEEILIAWLMNKTKFSKKQVREFLDRQNEFYNKLIKRTIIRNLKDES